MFFQTIALYVLISALATVAAIIVAKRRFAYDWLAYFFVGLAGGWIGGALFGAWGLVICGISVVASGLGAAFLIELDYCVDCLAEPEQLSAEQVPICKKHGFLPRALSSPKPAEHKR